MRRIAMNCTRRVFFSFAGAAGTLPLYMRFTLAQSSRPVRIIVGFAPGGATDVAARLISQSLSERLNQPFVVENRPGAGGNLASEAVIRSAPDGHTLLAAGINDAVNATLFDKLTYNFMRDTAPVAGIMTVPNLMVVHPSVPARTVSELISYARTNPGKVNMASAGTGSGPHMAGELFKIMAAIDITHVPYRGGSAAIPDLLAGQVQLMFTVPSLTINHIKANKLRALGVTTLKRWVGFPTLPTVSESLPGYEATNWFGIAAPMNTPAEVIKTLNREINACLAESDIQAKLAALGGDALVSSPAEFGKLIADETEKWGRVVHSANIKAG
jgi:tripartite-type tricarboxylate transporter receptor subunit TctC